MGLKGKCYLMKQFYLLRRDVSAGSDSAVETTEVKYATKIFSIFIFNYSRA